MVVEAEIKARVRDVAGVHAGLARWATPQAATYRDAYFDRAGELTGADRELRVREIHSGDTVTCLLTYKGPTVDDASGSKTELETTVGDGAAARAVLKALGYAEFVAFDKHCTNYHFERDGRELLATIVQVPQIDGTFIEVETIVDEDELQRALEAVRQILRELSVEPGDETRDTYTGAVLAARHGLT